MGESGIRKWWALGSSFHTSLKSARKALVHEGKGSLRPDPSGHASHAARLPGCPSVISVKRTNQAGAGAAIEGNAT
ncbi:hypothetical protein J1614_010740 [Plenodomus biglobosus]|nr:hypothetical protein J1614_010740 [Plenodomus biglobosus]